MPEANQCRRPVLAGWNCATRRDVCARVEKAKQETNEAHSLYGQNPADWGHLPLIVSDGEKFAVSMQFYTKIHDVSDCNLLQQDLNHIYMTGQPLITCF